MMFRNSFWMWLFLLLIIVATAVFSFPRMSSWLQRPKELKPERITPDPKATINKSRSYKLVFWDYEVPVGRGANWEDFVRFKIQEFANMHPNIEVKFKLIPITSGTSMLKEALKDGAPPDVFAGWDVPLVLDERLQIPVGPYLSEDDMSSYLPAAWNGLTVEGQIWSLPRWIELRPWLGNSQLLKAMATGELLNLDFVPGSDFRIDLNGKVLVATPDLVELLKDIAGRFMLSELFSAGAEKKTVQDVVQLIVQQVEAKKLILEVPARHGDKANVIRSFWLGNAAILGGVNGWLASSVWRDSNLGRVEAYLEGPSPRRSVKVQPVLINKQVRAQVSTVSAFLQANYKGDDHTRAAVEFAKFMSQGYSDILKRWDFIVPVFLEDHRYWEARIANSNSNGSQIIQLLDYANVGLVPSFDSQEAEEKLEAEIVQSAMELLKGKVRAKTQR